MNERGSVSIERAFTIGGVEKSVEQRINTTVQKIKEAEILDSTKFETDEDRKLAADGVIKSINPSFSSYEQVVNITRGGNYSEDQKRNAREVFDVLRKSISLTMNDGSNQELQTRLFTGGVEEVLPKSWLYGKNNSDLNLVDGVREVTITSSVIREGLKELEGSKAYKRIDINSEIDRELKARLIEDTTLKMIELDLPDSEEDQLRTVRSYLSTQVAILRGESKHDDGSTDKADQNAVLGRMTEVIEKMTSTIESSMDKNEERMREQYNQLLIEMRKKIGLGVDEMPEDYMPDGIDPISGETREAKYYSRYDITAEMLAVSMQLMDPNGARFDAYRPTEWYKKLPKEQRDVIDVMMEVSMAASATYYYGKDLDKILGSKVNFSFTSEKMKTLFDSNFKLVLSKMFNDLCETYTDQNLLESMRYKEGFYALPNKKNGTLVFSDGPKGENRWVLAEGVEIDQDGFLLGSDGKRIPLQETEYNIKEKMGKRGVAGEVMDKLRMVEDYKGELAYFLADHTEDGFMKYHKNDKEGHKAGDFILDDKGNKIPKPIYKMYANTAWNLWYGMGDSSLADRMRVLPTWNKIISDGIRTLNPEYKMYSKLMIFKGGTEKEPNDLEEAEYFTGEMGDYVIEVMDMERRLAEARGIKNGELPLKKGDKTMRQKILDGEVSLLPDKTFYGFFDFVNGGRDLVRVGTGGKYERTFNGRYAGDNVKKSLGQFLMDYAYGDEEVISADKTIRLKTGRKGVFIEDSSQRNDFNFRKDQVSYMNEFADSLQAAILYQGYIMGKADAKDPMSWARAVKSAGGMVNGIKFNGDGYFKYIKSPEMWRAMIVGCFKADKSRLSSDYIPIMRPENNSKSSFEFPYSFEIYDMLVGDFGLNMKKVDLVRLMQLLGVDVNRGQELRGGEVKRQTEKLERDDRERTRKLKELVGSEEQVVKYETSSGRSVDSLRNEFEKLNTKYKTDANFAVLRVSFNRAMSSNNLDNAEEILRVLKRDGFRI